jgi:hypothetical protein
MRALATRTLMPRSARFGPVLEVSSEQVLIAYASVWKFAPYHVDVTQVTIVGDDPLVDGMRISVRVRRDFTVTDAERLLDAARRAYRELHPDADPNEASSMVTCTADAVFTVLEYAGVVGDIADSRLARRSADGLAPGAWRAQVTIHEPDPLLPGRDCLRTGDVFALPATPSEDG